MSILSTLEAMTGNMTFREALMKRLSIIQPSLSAIEEFNKIQQNQLTPYVKWGFLFNLLNNIRLLNFIIIN